MSEDKLIDRRITISEIDPKEKLIILKDGSTDYSFWKSKKDGTDTVAHSQFKSFGLSVGESVDVVYKEEKNGNFTNYRIVSFKTDKNGTPNIKKEVDVESLIAQAIEAHERDYHDTKGVNPEGLDF